MRLQLRGIGPDIIKQYLMDLGGHEVDDGMLAGDGWTASVKADAPIVIGALRIGRTTITFAGDPTAIRHVIGRLEKKAIRAGG